MKHKFFAAIFAIVSALYLCLGLSACGKKDDSHTHSFTNYVYNNDATCTEDGTETATCDVCNEKDTRTKPGTALGHDFQTYISNDDATCTENGTETTTCERCHIAQDTRTKQDSVLGHDTELHAGTATCLRAGTLDFWQCKRCQKKFTDKNGETEATVFETDKPLGHDTELHAGTATCTQAGTLDFWQCKRCQKKFADENGKAEATVFETDKPLEHRYTAENKCDACGSAWKFTEGLKFTYRSNTDSYSVTGIGSATGEIVIPYGHEGKFVTSIGYRAFEDCTGLTSITIPDSVTSIEYQAFYKCTSLTSITIPNSVTSIGDRAFKDCTGLTSITIPDSVTSIGEEAFYNTAYYNDPSNWDNSGVLYLGNYLIRAKYTIKGSYTIQNGTRVIAKSAFSSCNKLTSITIPDSVTSIGSYAFDGCSGLTGELKIPNSVTSIASSAFYKCTGLTSITIPDSVTSIASWTFFGCTGLTNITIPNSVTSIGDYAFKDCTGLTSITIPDSVTSIENYAFKDCTGLTSITIPDSVTSIGYYPLFSGCESLEHITVEKGNSVYRSETDCLIEISTGTLIAGCKNSVIPNSVTSIGDYAFEACSSLTSITIPDSVTSIGDYAFYNTAYYNDPSNWDNSGVLYIGNYLIEAKDTITGSYTIQNGTRVIANSAFKGCDKLTSITIPNSVTSIGDYAFEDCTGLTSVTIGTGVTSIGYYPFSGCSGLTSITFRGTVQEWRAIKKKYQWDYNTGDYTITCTDGTIKKDGTVTYF